MRVALGRIALFITLLAGCSLSRNADAIPCDARSGCPIGAYCASSGYCASISDGTDANGGTSGGSDSGAMDSGGTGGGAGNGGVGGVGGGDADVDAADVDAALVTDAAMDAATDGGVDANVSDGGDPTCAVLLATVCDPVAVCDIVGATAACSCPSGYLDVSTSGVPATICEDIDECRGNLDDCDANAICANLPGAYSCTCNPGFEGNGKTCEDKCLIALRDRCDANALCSQVNNAAVCRCRSGYIDTSTAQDGSECTVDTQCTALNCDPAAVCDSSGGLPRCACPSGYTGNGMTCSDVDECTLNTDDCAANAACANNSGSFACTCNNGYAGNGRSCSDVDECLLGTANCHARADCTNTTGSYTCACQGGFTGNGTTCADIDECQNGTHNCNANAACTNTSGSFTCACNSGYSGDGVTCSDINECQTGTATCPITSTCNNTTGSYSCVCSSGYSGASCTDIDECTTSTHNCSTNGTCANTNGSFTCACNNGYSGNGVSCTDVDECMLGTDNCQGGDACTNTSGSYICGCGPGYSGSPPNCIDLNECAGAKAGVNTNVTAAQADTGTQADDNSLSVTGQWLRRSSTFGTGTWADNSDLCEAPAQGTRDAFFRISVSATTTFELSAGGADNVVMAVFPASATTFTLPNRATDSSGTQIPCLGNATAVAQTVTLNAGSYYIVVKAYTCSTIFGSCGFLNDGQDGTFYVDVRDTSLALNPCAYVASCNNTTGSYTCMCPGGYSGNGVGPNGCVDINECTLNTDGCDDSPNACVNTLGTFQCTCPTGYTGAGVGTNGCMDVNECMMGNPCGNGSMCMNTPGGYNCN